MEGESFDQFQTDLKRLALKCEFVDKVDSMIRNMILTGVSDNI